MNFSQTEVKNFWTWVGLSMPKKTDKTVKHNFSELSLAFEVDLQMIEHSQLSVDNSWRASFKKSPVFECYDDFVKFRVFKHLVMDFSRVYKFLT